MAITIPTPLRAAENFDSEKDLLAKLLNITAAVAQGDIRLGSAKQTSTVPSSAAILTVAGSVTTTAGKIAYIQNLGTNPLFVKRGAGASTTSAHYVLEAGTGADDGKGGSVRIEDFIGEISVAGTSPRFLAWTS